MSNTLDIMLEAPCCLNVIFLLMLFNIRFLLREKKVIEQKYRFQDFIN